MKHLSVRPDGGRVGPFSPALINVAINPFWLSRRALYRALAELCPALTGRVLDFGCGTGPYRALLTGCVEYIGLEYDSPRARAQGKADLFYDGVRIPLDDASVDGLLSTQSLEHVADPRHIVGEWSRVVKSGGLVLATVPFMWPEHETPWDFHRYTTFGLRNLLEQNGFEVLRVDRLLPDCRAPAQLFLAWMHDVWLVRRGRVMRRLLTALVCPPVALGASMLAKVSPSDRNTYLDNAVLARRRGKVS